MAGFGPLPADYADRYVQQMAFASDLYGDVIGAVNEVLPGAFMTQLGGMCLAIEAPVEGGWVWVGDATDNLPWDRAHHQGWQVHLYRGNPASDEAVDPLRYGSTDDSSLGGLMRLLNRVVYGVTVDEYHELTARHADLQRRAAEFTRDLGGEA